MCWECDNPDASPRHYLDLLEGLIDKHGYTVQGVEGDRIHPPWAYTIGLTRRRQPELVVTGMGFAEASALLNGVAAHVLHDTAPRHGEQIPLRGGPLIEVVELPEPSAHLHLAVSLYGTGITAIQLVHADDHGHWPWDPGYRGGQPVLGPRVR
jgi:hypothetical protein